MTATTLILYVGSIIVVFVVFVAVTCDLHKLSSGAFAWTSLRQGPAT